MLLETDNDHDLHITCCALSLTSTSLQAPPSAAWKQQSMDPRQPQQQHHQLGGIERPRLPRAGISAFAAPQVFKDV
jgi:hypothetical protein